MPKALNCLALILLLLHSTSCSTLRKATSNAESKLSKWDPKWQFYAVFRKIYLYKTDALCYKDKCDYCYRLDAWDDLKNNIDYESHQKNFYVCVYERKVCSNLTHIELLKKPKKLWVHQDLCDAYCQPIYNVRCLYLKKDKKYVC
jgi:hypothetical protein